MDTTSVYRNDLVMPFIFKMKMSETFFPCVCARACLCRFLPYSEAGYCPSPHILSLEEAGHRGEDILLLGLASGPIQIYVSLKHPEYLVGAGIASQHCKSCKFFEHLCACPQSTSGSGKTVYYYLDWIVKLFLCLLWSQRCFHLTYHSSVNFWLISTFQPLRLRGGN